MAVTEAITIKLAVVGQLLLKNSCSEYLENISEFFVAVGHRRAGMASVEASLSYIFNKA
jgi:hypothetical protein